MLKLGILFIRSCRNLGKKKLHFIFNIVRSFTIAFYTIKTKHITLKQKFSKFDILNSAYVEQGKNEGEANV